MAKQHQICEEHYPAPEVAFSRCSATIPDLLLPSLSTYYCSHGPPSQELAVELEQFRGYVSGTYLQVHHRSFSVSLPITSRQRHGSPISPDQVHSSHLCTQKVCGKALLQLVTLRLLRHISSLRIPFCNIIQHSLCIWFWRGQKYGLQNIIAHLRQQIVLNPSTDPFPFFKPIFWHCNCVLVTCCSSLCISIS